MAEETPLLHPEFACDERFWEQYAGPIVREPLTAIVELVANCWDAGATRVAIEWPTNEARRLSVKDNGEGMTEEEFLHRWGTLSYNRAREQPGEIEIRHGDYRRKRRVFGRNGIGRFAAFCFGNECLVTTSKEGREVRYLVSKGRSYPLEFALRGASAADRPGTSVVVEHVTGQILADQSIRTELSRRFLTDPSFEVLVNGVRIDFDDIEDKGLEVIPVEIKELGERATIKFIDAQRTDRTIRLHGVAWHVLGRLVGECGWKDPEQQSLIDGRRVEAKRFTFVVEADFLHGLDAVKPDWSGFVEDHEAFRHTNAAVQSVVTERLLEATKEKRGELTRRVRKTHSPKVRNLTPLRREKWNSFVEKVAEECPSLSERELETVSGVLATMELADTQYALLHRLHELDPGQIDDLHKILKEWTVDMAKIVLDEIQGRLLLIEELREKTTKDDALEVQELQPLFERGLWIFGPEFETIHYTSNEGMTKVIQGLFGREDLRGSRNRPDFVILPDGSAGFYSYPEYDDGGGELGPSRIVIVELKAPRVPITEDEKAQCYKYVRELARKGLLTERTEVRGFVLGRSINPVDRGEKKEMDDRVRIKPLAFDWVLDRAKSRLFKLQDKIKEAPFLKERELERFLDVDAEEELNLQEATEPVSSPVH